MRREFLFISDEVTVDDYMVEATKWLRSMKCSEVLADTIGVSNMIADAGGHYFIEYAVSDEEDYKYYLDLTSDVLIVCCFCLQG